MSDFIGQIPVPSVAPSGVFPLVTRYPFSRTLKRPVVVHQFGSANGKIEQRFFVGTPAERYIFQHPQLSRPQMAQLRNFWDLAQGCAGAFTYAVPLEDGTTTNKTVCFENQPLSLDHLTNSISSAGVTLVEIPDPAAAPVYTLTNSVTRFPDSTLNPALLSQVQEIIPLVHIKVIDPAYNSGNPDIYLSDRRVTIGSQLYLPRLLRIGDPGNEPLLTQSIVVDSSVPADDVTFAFGNADRVMVKLANDTQLRWARVELSLFHVGSGYKLDLWAGYVVDWHSEFGPEFTLKCSDILSALTLSSPVGSCSRLCFRRYGLDGCPAVPGSQAMDLVHFPASSNAACDLGYNTPNGCLAHQVETSFGGTYATPQSVLTFDKSNAGGGSIITPTSIINDTLFGDPLPEIWHSDEGVPQYGLPVECKIAAGRDESDYYIALGLIGKGPLGSLTAPQMYDSNGDGIPDTFIGSTLDGQPNHGFQVTTGGILKPGANATFGLRSALGTDPAGTNDYFSLGRVSGLGVFGPRGWFTNPADGSPMKEVAFAGSAYNLVYAAGMALLEVRRTDQSGIQPSLPTGHQLVAMISKGLSGFAWSAPGTRSSVAGMTDPFWVAVNTHLRSLGNLGLSATDQEAWFDVASAIACSAVASTVVPKIFGAGTEKQFQFQGVLDKRQPTRDWIQLVLNNAAGYYVWSFGKLKVGCRYNASAVSAFTAGNMLFGSLVLEPTKPKFEKLTVKFLDKEYLFAANTVDYVDQSYAARYGRIQNPLSSTLDLTGTASKSQAGRLATIRAREELGGVTQAEQDAARLVSLRTTILALETEAGQVVSVADSDLPGGTGKFRILNWRLNRDWSIDISGKTVTDSMYDVTVGPKPTDVAAQPVPTEGPAGWQPGFETPVSGDPLFSDAGFGIEPVYSPDGAGKVQVAVGLFGAQPADLSLQFKVRRTLVSGICNQVAAAVTTNTISLGGSGLTVDAFKGRAISKTANAFGSMATIPIQDFTITASDASGNFTVTPDPVAAGCVAGDVFTIRSGGGAGVTVTNPLTADATSYTDPLLTNFYNTAGLVKHGNQGNLALVISGTGAGQTPQTVLDNNGPSDTPANKVTITPGWDIVPDQTSVIVLVEANPQVNAAPDSAGGSGNQYLGSVRIDNYANTVVRIEGYTSRGAVLSKVEGAPFREWYVFGVQRDRVVTAATAPAGMFPVDGTMTFDTSGVTQPATDTLAVAITSTSATAITLTSGVNVVNGTVIQIDSEQMYVQSGGGGASLTVVRAWNGTTAATHSAAATVIVPGALTWTLVPFSSVPKQYFQFVKAPWSTDINFVKIVPSGSDPSGRPNQLPDNEAFHILADTSAAFGTYDFTVPAA